MTHLPGRETGHLSDATLAQYRARLKKLWKVYPFITDEKEREVCMSEMLKLSDKTGLELGGPALMRGPGRPRTRTNVSDDLLARVPEKMYDTSVQAHDEAMKKSERELREMEIMIKHGVSPERLAKVKEMQEESGANAKAQELERAIKGAQEIRVRELGRPLNHDEEAVIANAVQWEYQKRANEELAQKIEGDKGEQHG